MPVTLPVAIHSPIAEEITVHVLAADGTTTVSSLVRDGAEFNGSVTGEPGQRWWLSVDGRPPLVDPHAADVVFVDGRPWGVIKQGWPKGAPLGRHHPCPVVYELHVKGFGGTFAGVAERLGHIAGLGVDVIELMPVHPFDVLDNYWGYMPVVWGAVHRPYARGEDAAAELCALVAAAHDHGLEVWLDVVFNHTGEGSALLPTWTLEGLDPAHAYRHRPDGEYTDDSGCGNDVDPADPTVQTLVMEGLERLAELGFDGFRFDLASLLTRDGGALVAQITEWGRQRRVTLIAEAWDLAVYQVGDPIWPDDWLEWNDRFRDDVRGFLRGEEGKVPALAQRVQGSADLFPAAPQRSLNFVTAHDGLTMFDLTLFDDAHHHSTDTGDARRPQQLRNLFTLMLLSAGPAMFVMGDEFARTQAGNANPYNIDGPISWVDWDRAHEWGHLTEYVRQVIAVRKGWTPGEFRFHGIDADPDLTWGSHSLAWCSGNLYVIANGWREPLRFGIHEPGDWHPVLSTAGYDDGWVPAYSVVVLQRA